TTMNGDETAFGVNFADGRIKGYGLTDPQGGGGKTFFVMYVRGATGYGENDFVNNGDGTVTDSASGLMWMRQDSGHQGAGDDGDGKLNWKQALEWSENLSYAGHGDWRLPNAKELQSILDYSRSPATTGTAAIDPVFQTSTLTDEDGGSDFPFYWTGTTHANLQGGSAAAYVAFGSAFGWMQDFGGTYNLLDVHGAGAQRSDPKSGDPDDYPYGRGPQGDVVRIYNFVRCVRDAGTTTTTTYQLDVQSSPDTGVSIEVSPSDNNGSADGSTLFSRTYDGGTQVTLSAPASHNSRVFSKWTVGSTDSTSRSVQVTLNGNTTATVYYENASTGTPVVSLNRTLLNFAAIQGGTTTPAQEIVVDNSGEGSLLWTASAGAAWLQLNPASGSGGESVSVSINTAGLTNGTYAGTVTVSASNASNSPQTVQVNLSVISSGAAPFGQFATPLDHTTVSSSVPFTGWVLDDVGVDSVKLYRDGNGALLYVGEALLVEGVRPDVQQAYPGYPCNYKAGWGYMMLTNFLPGGNGTFTIHAIATDVEGLQTTLGTRTITVNNSDAVNPFGAIDTPQP
ncbi:MAG: DUF1566 domain-containing protein, partial [bacterium]|nr:DUF1566 domain-containing protein [bacterium]